LWEKFPYCRNSKKVERLVFLYNTGQNNITALSQGNKTVQYIFSNSAILVVTSPEAGRIWKYDKVSVTTE
jgi:hypothetical protein